MAGSNELHRTTGKFFTDFSYLSPVYASLENGLADNGNFIMMHDNIAGDDNTLYGIVVHPYASQEYNTVYNAESDATGLTADLYMQITLDYPPKPPATTTKISNTFWIKVGESTPVTAGTLFKFEHLRAANYKLVVSGASATDYVVNVSFQYEPSRIATPYIKYSNPPRMFNTEDFTEITNSTNNIKDFNTEATKFIKKESPSDPEDRGYIESVTDIAPQQ